MQNVVTSVTVDVTMPVGNVPALIFAVADATYQPSVEKPLIH